MLPSGNGQHNQTGVVTGDGAAQVVALAQHKRSPWHPHLLPTLERDTVEIVTG